MSLSLARRRLRPTSRSMDRLVSALSSGSLECDGDRQPGPAHPGAVVECQHVQRADCLGRRRPRRRPDWSNPEDTEGRLPRATWRVYRDQSKPIANALFPFPVFPSAPSWSVSSNVQIIANPRIFTTWTARRHVHTTNSNPPTPSNQVINLPNLLSFARLLSGPAIGHLILTDNLSLAIPCLVLSALTDWLDGYTARHTNSVNVLGSYLDPLADKVLVGSVVICMGWAGLLDTWLFGLIIGRDVLIVAGSFVLRFRRFGYTWPAGGTREFFNLQAEQTSQEIGGTETDGPDRTKNDQCATINTTTKDSAMRRHTSTTVPNAPAGEATKPAEPLYISKVNTVAQLTLIAATLTNAWIDFPSHHLITTVLAPATAVTTVTSGLAYVDAYRKGTIRI